MTTLILATVLIERILAEGAIGCAEAARVFATVRNGRPCHPSTVNRYCLKGVPLPDGSIVKLEHFRAAKRLLTSRAALVRFLAAQQVPVKDLDQPPNLRCHAEAADRELEELGA